MEKYEKYTKGIDFSRLPPEAERIMIALGQSQNGEEIDQICNSCNSILCVEAKILKGEHRPCAWIVSCACGKCNSTFRGL